MRYIKSFLFSAVALSVMLLACSKVEDLPQHNPGTASVLSASSSTIAPIPADSNNVALKLNWTSPNYATDSANYKFIIEIDSAGKGFTNVATKTVVGTSSASFIAKELNSILLARGYAFNVPVDMDIRLISSYANNNQRITSNTIRVKMTPYKIPPKIPVPSSGKLFIVGGATTGGWTNPVPAPSQELHRIDETTFGGIFQLTAGQSYLLLPVNGSWAAKYGANGANNSNNPAGDDFKAEGGDMLAPATTGWYKMIIDFQTGKFTVTAYTQQHGLPTDLFIVGDATPGQWSNPVPVPSQRFTRINSTAFELPSVALTSGKKYLLLPENGNWGKKFGSDGAAANTKLAGTFKPEGGDMDSPDVSGNYKITVNFINNTYNLVKL